MKIENKIAMVLLLSVSGSATTVFAQPCSASMIDQPSSTLQINCNLTLKPQTELKQQIIFQGAQASNTILDCQGAKLVAKTNPTILIQSIKQGNAWSVPKNITIKNCVIDGAVRIQGMGRNGESSEVKASSIQEGHTQRLQHNAPSNITLQDSTLIAGTSNMLYLAPGVHDVNIKNNQFIGKAGSLAIYLDAESKANRIENNIFDVQTPSRELIAIDGSAYNVIANNQFKHPKHGAIFLYRNCGEGGTVRHQTPSYNQIIHNRFIVNKHLQKPLIWLGSRNGNRNYCALDAGYDFGSSQSDLDYAEFNQVTHNNMQLKKAKWYEFWLMWTKVNPIQSNSSHNTIANNSISYQ